MTNRCLRANWRTAMVHEARDPANVRCMAHYGLKPEVRSLPKSAISGHSHDAFNLLWFDELARGPFSRVERFPACRFGIASWVGFSSRLWRCTARRSQTRQPSGRPTVWRGAVSSCVEKRPGSILVRRVACVASAANAFARFPVGL